MWEGLKVVRPEDTLYHLGDFAFSTMKRLMEDRWSLMPQCEKIFLEGNHDIRSKWRRLPWDKVVRKENQPLFLTYKGYKIAMAHWPQKLDDVEADICIHGHIHNLGLPIYRKNGQKWINVSVEHWNYKPILLNDLVEKYDE